MKYLLKSDSGQFKIENRSPMDHRSGGLLCIDDQKLHVEWSRHASVAFVRVNDSRLEKVVRFLAIDREHFAGESEERMHIHLPLAGGGWNCSRFQATVDAPGQDQRKVQSKNVNALVRSPMTGKVLQVRVGVGDLVQAGDLLMIIEAMKMENKVLATSSGEVTKIQAEVGRIVNTGDTLVTIKPHS